MNSSNVVVAKRFECELTPTFLGQLLEVHHHWDIWQKIFDLTGIIGGLRDPHEICLLHLLGKYDPQSNMLVFIGDYATKEKVATLLAEGWQLHNESHAREREVID